MLGVVGLPGCCALIVVATKKTIARMENRLRSLDIINVFGDL
jgi:hypothetical protein